MIERLPDFLIVGAAKAGTTSLYYYLKEHPDIFLPAVKEPKYISSQIVRYPFKGFGDEVVEQGIIKNLKEYARLFSGVKREKRVGEASADNLYYYQTTGVIKKILYNPTIIILLRNPVERAFSAYTHLVRDDREPLSFEKGLEVERDRQEQNWEFIWFYKDVGLYYEQVKAYLENFDHVKIYLFDDLKNNTLKVVQDVYRFLEVDDSFIPSSIQEKFNVSGVPKNIIFHRFLRRDNLFKKSIRPVIRAMMPNANARRELKNRLLRSNLKKPEMNSATRQYLIDFFREDILKLQELIDMDLSSWLK